MNFSENENSYSQQLDELLELIFKSIEFNSKQLLELLQKNVGKGNKTITDIFKFHIKHQNNSFAFFKETSLFISENQIIEMLDLIVLHKKYEGDSEFLKKLASRCENLIILKCILEIDPVVLDDFENIFDLILKKLPDERNSAILLLKEIFKISFKSNTVSNLLECFFNRISSENSKILIAPEILDCYVHLVKGTVSILAIELIEFLIMKFTKLTLKEIPTEYLILTILNANILSSQELAFSSLLNDFWDYHLSVCLKDKSEQNSYSVRLKCALIAYSLDYWKRNLNFKIAKKIVKNSGANEYAAAELVATHMERIVNHNMDPPVEELRKCCKVLNKLIKKDSEVFKIIFRHLSSYCFAAKSDCIADVLNQYIFHFRSNRIVPASFFEIIPIKKLFLRSFLNRIFEITGNFFFKAIQNIANSDELFPLLTCESERFAETAEVLELLQWFSQFPSQYFTSFECQLLQSTFFIIIKNMETPSEIGKEICIKLLLRFMTTHTDLAITLHSSSYIDIILNQFHDSKEVAEIVSLTTKRLLSLMRHDIANAEKIVDLISILKSRAENDNLTYLEAFMIRINDSRNDITESVESSFGALTKITSKYIKNTGVRAEFLPILHQLFKWYNSNHATKKRKFLDLIPHEPEFALFLIEWDNRLGIENVTNLFCSLNDKKDLMLNALNIIIGRSDSELFECIIAKQLENFECSMQSLSLFVQSNDKCNLLI